MKIKIFFLLFILGSISCSEELKNNSIQDPNVRKSWRNFVDSKRSKIEQEYYDFKSELYHNLDKSIEDEKSLIQLLERSPNIRELDFMDTWAREYQDISPITKFKKLETLILTSKWNTNLPNGFENLTHLETLYISMDSLLFLPKEIGDLKKIKHLSINCKELIGFEHGSLDLPNLISLRIGECNRELKFPALFGDSNQLHSLSISGMDSIPPSIGSFKKLKTLSLDNIKSIPVEVENFKELEFLMISNCHNPLGFDLSAFSRLRILDVFNSNAKELRFSTRMKALKYLRLNNLEDIPKGIGTLNSLEFLHLNKLNLENMTESIVNAKELCGLHIEMCKNFNELPIYFNEFPSLIELDLRYNGIEKIPKTIFESESLKLINYFKEKKLELPEEYLKSDKIFFTNLEKTNFGR